MLVSDESILRANEQMLRRCTSLEAAKAHLPTLIDNISDESINVRLEGEYGGHKIYKLVSIQDSVYLIRGFINHSQIEDIMHEALNKWIDNPPHANSLVSQPTSLWREYQRGGSHALDKLRWSCVGYHYDWGNRTYDRRNRSEFPEQLTNFYSDVLHAVNAVRGGEETLRGDPQSAIINFYHSHRTSDRLGGHRDDVEVTDQTPLVALSMGLPGFFLIENEAILLRSGDVVVMAEGARQSLHGVPCIVASQSRKRGTDRLVDSDDPTERDLIGSFLSKTRVSISIRQVY